MPVKTGILIGGGRMNRVRGELTVLAGLSIMLVIALVCATIRSAADSTSDLTASAAANLAVESVFSCYSNPCMERFDIFALNDSDLIPGAIEKIASQNTKGLNGFSKINVETAQILEKKYMTDNGAEGFYTQAVQYMQYGIYDDLIEKFTDLNKTLNCENKTKELIEEISNLDEETVKISKLMLEFISVVEGIKTDDKGFVIHNNSPVTANEPFVKILCTDGISMQSANVNDSKIFDAMKEIYVDVMDLLYEIKDNASELRDADEDTPGYEISAWRKCMNDEAFDLWDYTQMGRIQCEYAIKLCDEYIKERDLFIKKAVLVEREIDNAKNAIKPEIYEALSRDAKIIKQFNMDKAICDMQVMQIKLKDILPIYESIENYAIDIKDLAREDDYGGVIKNSDYAVEVARTLNYDNLQFDYSKVSFAANEVSCDFIGQLKKYIQKGFMELVMEDTKNISKAKINYDDLADKEYSECLSHKDSFLKDIKNVILYGEYVISKFNSYMDEEDKDIPIQYQVEYVISGEKADEDNLYKTALKLSGIREVSNLTYLLTSSTKKKECEQISAALFGFTGIPALIVAGKYILMAGWAYAESIIDLKALFAKKKVSWIKDDRSWNLELKNLIKMNLSLKDRYESSGFDYEDYLRILLLLTRQEIKSYKAMALIEMWMLQKGYKDFRMKSQIYSMDSNVTFVIDTLGKERYYNKLVQYNY